MISSESTGSSTSSRGPDGGGGGGSSGVISDIDGQKSGYPPLKIMEVSYDTDTNIARIVVGPEYDVMDVVIKTSAGFSSGDHCIAVNMPMRIGYLPGLLNFDIRVYF